MSHHVEVFMDDDKTWGWQCFEAGCALEKVGLETFHAAEVAANLHADSKSAFPRLIPSWRFVVPETSEGMYDPDLQEARIHQVLGPDELEG
jgi:hypothetical protein